MVLSVIMPVFNEHATVGRIAQRVLAAPDVLELIIVDDGSTDGTREALQELSHREADARLRVLTHERNRGKGAAIRTALPEVRGEVVIIQDADLEYHPEDYPAALRLIRDGYADAVYGSRFLGPHRVFYFMHYAANKVLTFMTNVLFDVILTDVTTGFKMVRTEWLQRLGLKTRGFTVEMELTAKLMKRKCRLYEIPITYTGRGYDEGKKITWQDGFRMLWAILRFRVLD